MREPTLGGWPALAGLVLASHAALAVPPPWSRTEVREPCAAFETTHTSLEHHLIGLVRALSNAARGRPAAQADQSTSVFVEIGFLRLCG